MSIRAPTAPSPSHRLPRADSVSDHAAGSVALARTPLLSAKPGTLPNTADAALVPGWRIAPPPVSPVHPASRDLLTPGLAATPTRPIGCHAAGCRNKRRIRRQWIFPPGPPRAPVAPAVPKRTPGPLAGYQSAPALSGFGSW